MRARRWSMCAGLISAAVAWAGAAPVPSGNGMIPPTVPAAGAGGVEISGPDILSGPDVTAGDMMVEPAPPQVIFGPMAAQTSVMEPLPPEREPGPDVKRWVEALHSPEFRVRDAATINLMQIDVAREAEVRYALSHETDDEASARLFKAAIHLVMKKHTPTNGDIGLLGISLWTEPMRINSHADLIGTVVVTEVKPGFPAEEYLKPGDRLTSVNGETFLPDISLDYFKSKVMGATPGRPLHLTFLRNGKMMKADVPLASAPKDEPLLQYIDNRQGEIEDLARIYRPAPELPLILPDPESDQSESMHFEAKGQVLIIPPNGGRVIIGPGQLIMPNGNGGLMIVPQPVIPPEVDDNNSGPADSH